MERNQVILVDENDKQIGVCDKLEAHEKALLHRAFSIFLFNEKKEILLQQRAMKKYHSAGLWTNTVCSHPQVGDELEDSAKKRLIEEMGIETEIWKIFSFVYKSNYDNGLSEHEYDHVFVGKYNDVPNPNPDEVMNYKWMHVDDLIEHINSNPQDYTSWFKIIMQNDELISNIKEEVSKF